MKLDYLFVYGTLLSNIENSMSRFLSANSEYVGKAYFVGKIYNIHDYPGAILSTNASERCMAVFIKLLIRRMCLKY
ncbi:gamma-glutamylcyclotransferase [Jejuia pallidilutea]|uniref:gamma-glutamylcyclotransferase n=1 Tax=Jejuia pallidilutea TaxID=504487 RepID=UPI001269DAAD